MSWIAEKLDPDWPFDIISARFKLNRPTTALIIIDMQVGYVRMDPEGEIGRKYPRIVQYWNERNAKILLPQTKRLLDYFRKHNLKVAFTRNGSVTPCGEEMSPRLRKLQYPASDYRGKPDYEVIPELKPLENELIVDKLTSGAFTGSYLDHALRNMKITDLVVSGIYTDMCVLGTSRIASELGYNTLICEDACGALTQRTHDEALLIHARRFGRVATTEDVIKELSA